MTQLDLFGVSSSAPDEAAQGSRPRMMRTASGLRAIVEPRGDHALAWQVQPWHDAASLLREALTCDDGIASWSPLLRIPWPHPGLVEVSPDALTGLPLSLF